MTERLTTAIAHLRAGRLREAEYACRQVLRQNTADPNAWHLLGIVAGQVGRHDVAADLIRRAIALRSDVAVFHSNLGLALMSDGKLDLAAASLREALRLEPDHLEAHLRLGTLHLQRGAVDEAIRCFQRAVRISDGSAVAHHSLAEAYRRRGATDEAIKNYQLAIERDSRHAPSYNNLAGLLLDRGDFPEAIECLQALLRLSPKSAQAYNNLGSALQAMGQAEQAIQCYRNAIKLSPDFDMALSNLASLLADAGQLDEALACYGQLAELQPDDPEGIAGRAKVLERQGRVADAASLLEPFLPTPQLGIKIGTICAAVWKETGRPDDAVEILDGLLADPATRSRDRIPLHFSLGAIFDERGEYPAAFRQFQEGNRLKARSCKFNPTRYAEHVQRLVQAFSRRQMDRLPCSTVDSDLPVFIVGMPRSGTSLVEQILASHPQVFGGGELRGIQELLDATRAGSQSERQPADEQGVVRIVPADPDQVRSIPDDLDSISAARLNELAQRYLLQIRGLAGESAALRISDKMPFNFRHLGFMRMLFPRARVIHCRRDARDTCLSCYFQNFLRGNHFSYTLASLGAYYRGYERLVQHWRDEIGLPMFEVQYEDLVADPERHVRELVTYCGLDWDLRCLQFYQSRRVVHTASYQQVRKPIYEDSVGRWKHYREHLTPLFEALRNDANSSSAGG